MSDFSALNAAAESTIHALYGDLFLHLPMARSVDVSAAAQPDAARPAGVTFMGVHHVAETSPIMTHAYDPKSARRPGVSAPKITITVPSDANVVLKTGDMLQRVADGAKFRVVDPFTAETGAVIAEVNAL